ncbi:hypothetical protein PIB30_062353 [Stylosanthes scabra]|uniref:Uncharacterized protein n=1 Tax=Stylosanthes scabra TaxID=79078 RepID=A0ABU6YJZ1_9FABA|nr:hypothetical protein [Stylosanthes scabra]
MQERQDEFSLSSSEKDVPQDEEGILEQEGSHKGNSKPILRATTIDEFFKEHGIDVELEGLTNFGQSTEQNADEGDPLALDKDYSQHVMADIIDDEGRNKRMASLLYTSWIAVPPEKKKFIWNCTNTKFILPASTQKWVSPSEFIMLVLYWSHPLIQALDAPKSEAYESQQVSGETEEEAFKSLFVKEQPARVRCYKRSITQADLRMHGEVYTNKQQHQEEVYALQSQLGALQTQQQQQATQQQQQAEEIH